jgi:hypothetical protein
LAACSFETRMFAGSSVTPVLTNIVTIVIYTNDYDRNQTYSEPLRRSL